MCVFVRGSLLATASDQLARQRARQQPDMQHSTPQGKARHQQQQQPVPTLLASGRLSLCLLLLPLLLLLLLSRRLLLLAPAPARDCRRLLPGPGLCGPGPGLGLGCRRGGSKWLVITWCAAASTCSQQRSAAAQLRCGCDAMHSSHVPRNVQLGFLHVS